MNAEEKEASDREKELSEDPSLSGDNCLQGQSIQDEPSQAYYPQRDLYHSTQHHFDISTLLYGMSEMRTLARRGLLEESTSHLMMNLPITAYDALRCVHENQHVLKEHLSPGSVELYMTVLDRSMEEVKKRPEVLTEHLQKAFVVKFDDDEATGDMVHAILVDRHYQEVIVGFRGSVTVKDFLTDAKTFIETIENPAVSGSRRPELPPVIGVHQGFVDYLYGRRRKRKPLKLPPVLHTHHANNNDIDNKAVYKPTVCESILEDVAQLMEEHPGYQLYTTGHSLGGALATLFAFEAAASRDPRMNLSKPATCLSFASPHVGNIFFRVSFQALELEGKLRSLRIANYKDVVTLLPGGMESPCDVLFCPRRLYHHVGMKIKLRETGPLKVSYKGTRERFAIYFVKQGMKVHRNIAACCGSVGNVCCGSEDLARNHSCLEYQGRLGRVAKELEGMTLDDLYDKNMGKSRSLVFARY